MGHCSASFDSRPCEMAVLVLLDDAVSDGGFDPAAGFDVDDLRIDSSPFSCVVFVVDADLIDVRDLDRLLRNIRELSATLVDHRGDDAIGDARGLQRDERIGVSDVLTGLRVDGLDDEVVAQARLHHLQDRIVVHSRCFGRGQRTVDLRRLGRMRWLCDRKEGKEGDAEGEQQRAQQCLPKRHSMGRFESWIG
jgi:hypothetical protein